MTAIRSVRAAEGRYVQIANSALQDHRLSLSARGLIGYVLSLPPDKTFTAAWLETQVPDGRREIRSALRELAAAGYYRSTKHSTGGTWIWDQVISDAPLTDEDADSAYPQVSADDRNRPDASTSEDTTSSQVDASDRFVSDAKRSDKTKDVTTKDIKDEDQKMAQERASRRAHASGASISRTTPEIISQVRLAVAEVCGEADAEDLTDGEVLGLYFRYGNPKRPARDLAKYLVKILEDAGHVDGLLANAEAVCVPCWAYESACTCG